jgi:hypothetical protein
MSCGGRQWSSTFDPSALTGTVHRFPLIAAPLHIQPKIRAVAEHAGKDERGRSGPVATVVAQFVDVLALHPHRYGQCVLRQPIGYMNSYASSSTWLTSPITRVVQIDACRFTPAAIPLEDEPPSLVDANRMESFKIAAQLFEVIT